MTSSSQRPTPFRAALIVAALVALVLAQSLGLAHRLAHANRGPAAALGAVWSFHETSTPSHWQHALFGGHHQKGDCESYDQLTHGDALKSVSSAMQPVVAPLCRVVVHRTWILAAQAAGFLARGPPA